MRIDFRSICIHACDKTYTKIKSPLLSVCMENRFAFQIQVDAGRKICYTPVQIQTSDRIAPRAREALLY